MVLGDQCQITTIATDRHFQGQGYASQLMEYALEKVKNYIIKMLI